MTLTAFAGAHTLSLCLVEHRKSFMALLLKFIKGFFLSFSFFAK